MTKPNEFPWRGASENADGVAAAAVATGVGHPTVPIKPVTNSVVLDRQQLLNEIFRQATPLADPGSPEAQTFSREIARQTARPRGLSAASVERYATASRSVPNMLGGANRTGKAAEIVVVNDIRREHSGHETGMVNPGPRAANVADIRISPDPNARRDVLYLFECADGTLTCGHSGQVKTGQSSYLVSDLVKMANTPGYGKTGYVDARFVNPDGTPRIAEDAFTSGEARRLREARVNLRGIRNLDKRATSLVSDADAVLAGRLDPVAQAEIVQLRNDIRAAYEMHPVAGRLVGTAALGAVTAAVLSMVVQLVTQGQVDAKVVGQTAGVGAAYGGAATALDAAVYHGGTKLFGMAPEAAKAAAGPIVSGVLGGFAIFLDVRSEVQAVKRGGINVAEAVSGSAAKMALDLLPFLLAPLGIAAVPILLVTQFGGRWLLADTRAADRRFEAERVQAFSFSGGLDARLAAMERSADWILDERADVREEYLAAMGLRVPSLSSQFR